MDNNKKKLVIWVAVVVAVVGLVLIWTLSNRQEPAGPEIIRTTDPDTGDEIITVPGKETEFDPAKGAVILGAGKMLDSTTMTNAQYQLIVETVKTYVSKHVGKEATAIKFLPDTVKSTATTPAGVPYKYKVDVKTENPAALLKVSINLVGLDQVKITITYPEKPSVGRFNSGILPSEEENFDQGI